MSAASSRPPASDRGDDAAATDPLAPPATLLVKLGSALVHAQEMTEPGAHPLDLEAFKSLCADPEVAAWLEAMGALALLPVKRSA
jgi:hypothetical protein